jgi:chromate reductase
MRNKNAAVIGASTSMFGAVWAQAELRKVLAAAGARVIGRELALSYADEAFDGAGRLLDIEVETALAAIVGDLVDQLRASSASRAGAKH